MSRGQSILFVYILGMLMGIGLLRLTQGEEIAYLGIAILLNVLWLPVEWRKLSCGAKH